MENQIITIIVAVLSSGLIQFFFNKWQEKHSLLAKIQEELLEIRKVATRTNLLMLMSDYPNRHEEIMKVAQNYFSVLGGNYYASTLFSDWLEKEKLDKPNWFTKI